MERRKAVAAAAAASLTFVLGAAGLTANATILGSQKADGIGQISPVPTPAAKPGRPAAPEVTTTDVATTLAPQLPKPQPVAAPPVDLPAAPTGSAGPGGSSPVHTPQTSDSHASAPVPVATTAPATTHSGGSPVATGTSGGEHEEEVEHEEHEEEEHEAPEGTDGSEDDD